MLRGGLRLETRRHPRLKQLRRAQPRLGAASRWGIPSRELLAASALLCLLSPSPVFATDPITYTRSVAAGASLHVIEVDLNDPRVLVSPALAAGGVGRTESFSSFIRRLKPAAAVNGTYFGKTTNRPVGDIVIDGKLVHFGGMGTALAFASDGVDCIRLPKSRHVDWSDHRAALAAGPLLVWQGFAKPLPGGEGFGDPSLFARAAPRTAVGVTPDNHLLLVTTARGTSLSRLAAAMRDLGALYAIGLDGGGSSAMSYRDRTIRSSGRPLTNLLCVYVKPEPAPRDDLRPPRGLDWRGGHPARPVLTFSAGDLVVTVKLPRRPEGEQSISVDADRPLPEGWTIAFHLDQRPAGATQAFPAEFPIDFSTLKGPNPKHVIWIGVLDSEGKAVAGVQQIFKLPGSTW